MARPTNEERKKRDRAAWIAKLLEELGDADLLAAESAMNLLRDDSTTPAVRLQCAQLLEKLNVPIRERVGAGPESAPVPQLDVGRFLGELRTRVRALQDHFGKPIIELLGDASAEPFSEQPDARIG